ncbi:MAG TPA: hypothetical protein VHN19_09020 [Burkholderiales bacterium]|jgi:uncharacterized membrane protein (DUF441 family)|nr:hypothetical protein [Burkholderiales bacterium]
MKRAVTRKVPQRWSPETRLMAGALGGTVIAIALVKRAPVILALAAGAVALIGRLGASR